MSSTPYYKLTRPVFGMIATVDFAWLGESAYNLQLPQEMIKRSIAYVERVGESVFAHPGIREVADGVLQVAQIQSESADKELAADVVSSVVIGWAIAKCEEAWGWAKRGKVHAAAHAAKEQYVSQAFQKHGVIHSFAVECGYYFARTGKIAGNSK